MGEDLDARAIWLGKHVLPHEPALRAWLQKRRLTGLDVDDIIQETYTRLISAESIDNIRNPRSYAFETAKSVIYTHLRRAKVVPMTAVADLDALGLGADIASPEDHAVDRDELQRLAEAISALPESPRMVFKLRRIDELPQKAIALKLGISEKRVEKLMGQALFRLRNLLGRDGEVRSRASKRDAGVARRDHVQTDRTPD